MAPTTPVRDVGAGSDSNPIQSPWAYLSFYGGSTSEHLKRLSDQIASANATGSRRGAYRNEGPFGPDIEVHGRIAVEPANNTEAVDWWLAIYGIGGTITGYFVRYLKNQTGGVDTIQLIRRDSAANVVIGSFVENNLPPNDRYLARRTVVGATQTLIVEKYDSTSSTWIEKINVVDNAYTGTARIGHGIEGTATRTVDFGGGTVGVGIAPTNAKLPVISGAAETWQTLAVDTGAWNGSPTTYAYQWKRDGTAITGATASSYTLDVPDEGHTITCTVTASNATGSASVTSAGVSAVPFSGGSFQVMWIDPTPGEWRPKHVKRASGGVWVVA